MIIKKRLVEEFIWVAIGQGFAVAGSVVGIRVLTHWLEPKIYGEVALALTIATLGQQVFIGPCVSALMRFFASAAEERQLGAFYHAGLRIVGRATFGILVLAAVAAVGLVASGFGDYVIPLLLATTLALLTGYNAAMDGIQNAARQRVIVAWHQGLGQWLRWVVIVPAIYLLGRSSAVALLGLCVGTILVMISQSFFLSAAIPRQDRILNADGGRQIEASLKRMREYAWPFAIWGTFGWLQFSADKWALQIGSGPDDVGLFAVLYQIGIGPLVMLGGFLTQLVAPILFQRAGSGLDSSRVRQVFVLNRRLCYASLAVTALGFGFLLLFHRQIFALLVAESYQSASPWLPWMALSGGLFVTAQIAALSLLSEADSRALLAPKVVTGLGSVVLFFSTVWRYKLAGIVWSGLVMATIYLVWIYCLGMKRETAHASSK